MAASLNPEAQRNDEAEIKRIDNGFIGVGK